MATKQRSMVRHSAIEFSGACFLCLGQVPIAPAVDSSVNGFWLVANAEAIQLVGCKNLGKSELSCKIMVKGVCIYHEMKMFMNHSVHMDIWERVLLRGFLSP